MLDTWEMSSHYINISLDRVDKFWRISNITGTI